jgi:HAMP domain-containing protein
MPEPLVTSSAMTPGETVESPTTQQQSVRQLGLSSRLVLNVLPLAVVSLSVGAILVWSILSGDESSRLSWTDWLGIGLGAAVLLAAVGTIVAVALVGRSTTRDISRVTSAAKTMAHKDLIDLLDTLRSTEPDLAAIRPLELEISRQDEVGELARAFEGLHSSLIEVAARQMEALRQGVSSIFVTLSRRNGSLIDRQLALLDELEAREEDAKTLAGYYQLDHFATRMRRNAESLLVLAGSESPRIWAKPTEMSDVVRAAVGEVDEYQRVDVLALEPARLSGGAVSDVSHLLAEILENALQFSPPSEAVRVTGLFEMDGYQLTVSDRGVGVSEARVAELNRILDEPPALGLSVEPTLGMYVVAKLAHRHGVSVELIRGLPGLTVRVTVPRDHLEAAMREEPKYWEADRGTTTAAPEAPVSVTDPATRQYLSKQRADRDEMVAAAPTEEVVDLTAPEMMEGTSLPVRDPGRAFSDEDHEPSTGPGEGAISLRSALAAFDQGRRAARESSPTEDES